jgi:hypothetical protein
MTYNKGNSDIICPFCGEGNMDLIGLKNHLLVGGLSYDPCKAFTDTLTIEEERNLRNIEVSHDQDD